MRTFLALCLALPLGCATDTSTVVHVRADQTSVMHVETGCTCAETPLGACVSYGDTTPPCRCESAVTFNIEGVGPQDGFAFGNFAGATLDVDGQVLSLPSSYPPAATVSFGADGKMSWLVDPPSEVLATNGGFLVGLVCHEPAGVMTAPIGRLDAGEPSVTTLSSSTDHDIAVLMMTTVTVR